MKVFKSIRFYLSAALVLFLAVGLSACGEGTKEDTVVEVELEEPIEAPVMATAPGMVFDKDDRPMDKARKIKAHLRGRYKINDNLPGGSPGIQPQIDIDRSLGGIVLNGLILHGEFTPPGLLKKAGATDDELRASARAFLNAERSIFGIEDAVKDLKESGFETNPSNKVTGIHYGRYIEGLPVVGSHIKVGLRKNGMVIYVDADLVSVSSEMVAAAKRYKAEGIDAAGAKASVAEYLRGMGLSQELSEGLDTGQEPELLLFVEAPYAVWRLSVGNMWNEEKNDWEWWTYTLDAITGKVLDRVSDASH